MPINESPNEFTTVTDRLVGRVGRISIVGRYHRLPCRLEDDYTLSSTVLGKGECGEVIMATRKGGDSQQRYAVKTYALAGIEPKRLSMLLSEVETFLYVDHPHIARLYGIYESTEQLHFVMESMEGGMLLDRFRVKGPFPEAEAIDTVWQILLALNYIHLHNIVHRDVKLDNFVYDHEGSCHLKLIDFGFSKIFSSNTRMRKTFGTLLYVAPEVLEKSYTCQCDLWSLGVTTFALLAGHFPFMGNDLRSRIKDGRYDWKPEQWRGISEDAVDFVKSLLQVDPQQRLTAQAALEHRWIAGRRRRSTSVDPSMTAEALRAFGRTPKFRRCCMEMLAWSLSSEDRAKVRDEFLMLDVSGRGTITLAELKATMAGALQIPDDEVQRIFAVLDKNRDERINYSEFLAAMVSSRIALHDDLIKETFRRFDAENAGYITQEALTQILGEDIDVKHVMAQIDQNHDNKISHAEFIAYLRNGNAHASHEDAANRLIDKHLQSADAEPDGSPVRLRKRDKLMMFAKTALGMTRSTSDAPTP